MKKLYAKNKETNNVEVIAQDTQENLERLKKSLKKLPAGICKYENLEIRNS